MVMWCSCPRCKLHSIRTFCESASNGRCDVDSRYISAQMVQAHITCNPMQGHASSDPPVHELDCERPIAGCASETMKQRIEAGVRAEPYTTYSTDRRKSHAHFVPAANR